MSSTGIGSRFGGPSFLAGGTIAPNKIVKLSTAAEQTVLTAGAGEKPIGISPDYQKRPPGTPGADDAVCAEAGDQIDILTDGDIGWVTAGGTVAIGDDVKSDATGRAVVVAATDNNSVGIALMAGTVGTLIRVWIKCRYVKV